MGSSDTVHFEDYIGCASGELEARRKMLLCPECKGPLTITQTDEAFPEIGPPYKVETRRCRKCKYRDRVGHVVH